MVSWGKSPLHPPTAPDSPCTCVEMDRKAAVRDVRTLAVDALAPDTAPADVAGWRDLAVEIIRRLKGL